MRNSLQKEMGTFGQVIAGSLSTMGNNSHNIKRFRSKHLSQVIVVDTGKENQEESEGQNIQESLG